MFHIIDQNGQTRLVMPHQITMRRDTKRVVSTDHNGHELRIGDNVKEVEGEVSVFLIRLSNNRSNHVLLYLTDAPRRSHSYSSRLHCFPP